MDSFTLRKSYTDVVDQAGRCAIAYSTQLDWGPLAVRWEGLTLREPGRPAAHRSAWNKSLGCRASVLSWCPPFGTRLLETEAGKLDWACDAPGADVALEAPGGLAVRGAGYAEHLVLTLAPWKLPIDELRWGRWVAPESRHSIVWIEWRGSRPLTLVLENGTPREGSVGDDVVACGDGALRLDRTETMYARTLADALGAFGPVVRRLPASWRALEDRKALSRGLMGSESGWAIHEIVRFP
jgi:hypothetical protein